MPAWLSPPKSSLWLDSSGELLQALLAKSMQMHCLRSLPPHSSAHSLGGHTACLSACLTTTSLSFSLLPASCWGWCFGGCAGGTDGCMFAQPCRNIPACPRATAKGSRPAACGTRPSQTSGSAPPSISGSDPDFAISGSDPTPTPATPIWPHTNFDSKRVKLFFSVAVSGRVISS